MAKNTGDNTRKGAVSKREKWTKRDKETGQFIDVKSNGEPFKGVTKK
ncbi:MAG: hypothetical protein PHD14_00520 [Dehalococcoidales bacterium]|nr:hypothetical protein [Dehalococcoidales bacterium]